MKVRLSALANLATSRAESPFRAVAIARLAAS